MNLYKAGLSSTDVKKGQLEFGRNVLPEKRPPGSLVLFLRQLQNPLVYVLCFAGLVTAVIGHFSDTAVIGIAIIINTVLGFVQEKRASDALRALKQYVVDRALVVRDGKRVEIDSTDIVPGDTVVLAQGKKIPADGVLTDANRLYLNESMLTGESMPVSRRPGDGVLMGTSVAAGQGMMTVTNIGSRTKIGSIAIQVQEKEEDTPLQKQLKIFSRKLIWIIGILLVVVVVVGLVRRLPPTEILTTSVALAVSSIPEGLIVSLTVVLAIGMQKILKRRGLVRKLVAAETLGGVTIIGVDKTGTLTLGKMEVVDCIGVEKQLAEQALLANDLDDPLTVAMFEWGRTVIKDFVSEHQRLDSIPFFPQERFFSSLHKWSENTNRLYVNGAPESLLEWVDASLSQKQEILSTLDNLAGQGKRLVGFAFKDVPVSQTVIDSADVKGGLTWAGMLAFFDPVRPGAGEALRQAEAAGIRTVVITGDYAKTSGFVLTELGIHLCEQEILTGEELGKLGPEELSRKIGGIRLFARTTPDQKLRIIEAFKRNGEVVTMMGDGVNDAPALHKADIGIAVAEATDVSKESADLVLLDSNFATIVGAIEEGRVMFDNIRKIVLYLMCDAFAEIILVVGALLMGLPLPLTAIQILWINLVSDGFPNLSLAVDPKRPGIMKERPRAANEPIITGWMVALMTIVSFMAGVFSLLLFVFVYRASGDLTLARSVAFLTLGVNSLAYVFSVKLLMTPVWKGKPFENRWLVVAVAAGLALQAVPFLVPSLHGFFGIKTLHINWWLAAAALSIMLFLLVETFKLVYSIIWLRVISRIRKKQQL